MAPKHDRFITVVVVAVSLTVSGLFFSMFSHGDSSDVGQEPEKTGAEKIADAVDYRFVCRATVASLFSRDIKIISASSGPDGIVIASYVRPNDGVRWTYACRFDGNRVVWATVSNAEIGRWRTHALDEQITFSALPEGIRIKLVEGAGHNGATTTQISYPYQPD